MLTDWKMTLLEPQFSSSDQTRSQLSRPRESIGRHIDRLPSAMNRPKPTVRPKKLLRPDLPQLKRGNNHVLAWSQPVQNVRPELRAQTRNAPDLALLGFDKYGDLRHSNNCESGAGKDDSEHRPLRMDSIPRVKNWQV